MLNTGTEVTYKGLQYKIVGYAKDFATSSMYRIRKMGSTSRGYLITRAKNFTQTAAVAVPPEPEGLKVDKPKKMLVIAGAVILGILYYISKK